MMNSKKNTLSSILTLMSGSIFAQLFTFIATPLMGRFFTPEEIGFNTLLLTFVTMFGPVLSLKLEVPIVSEDNKRIVAALAKSSLIILIVISGIITIFYSFGYLNAKSIIEVFFYGIVMFIMLFTTGINNIVVSYNNKEQKYGFITKVYVLRSVVKNLLIIITGAFSMGNIGLVLSNVSSQLVSLKKQLLSVKVHLIEMKNIKRNDMLNAIKLYKKQIFFSAPAAFFNSFSYSSINMFIKNLFGFKELGYYSMSFLILGMPLSLISANVSKVYFEKASKEFNLTNKYSKTFLKVSSVLILLSIPITLGMYFAVPPLLELFLGKSWVFAGTYIKILSPMFGVRFIVSSVSLGTTISKRQGMDFFIQILFILSSVIIYILASYLTIGIQGYLSIISVVYTIIYLIYFFYLYNISKN